MFGTVVEFERLIILFFGTSDSEPDGQLAESVVRQREMKESKVSSIKKLSNQKNWYLPIPKRHK